MLVTTDQVSAVVDVRRRYGGTTGQVLGGPIGAGNPLSQSQAGRGIRVHEPYADAIPIGRRSSIGAARLAVAGGLRGMEVAA